MGVGAGGGPKDARLDTFADALRLGVMVKAPSLALDPSFKEVLTYVARETVPEEREALLAAAQLGGAEGVLAMLEERFGPGLGWVPFRFVRLRPPRESYKMLAFDVTFIASVGWHKVSSALAAACVEANEDRPREPVFDVAVERPEGNVAELGK